MSADDWQTALATLLPYLKWVLFVTCLAYLADVYNL